MCVCVCKYVCVCEFLLINNEHVSSWQIEEVEPDGNNAASAPVMGSQTTFSVYGSAKMFLLHTSRCVQTETHTHCELALPKSSGSLFPRCKKQIGRIVNLDTNDYF